MAIIGLLLNTLGVIVLAIAQGRLDTNIRVWLIALDWGVESIIDERTPSRVYVSSMGRQMDRTLKQNRWFVMSGWLITAVGFICQLIPLVRN